MSRRFQLAAVLLALAGLFAHAVPGPGQAVAQAVPFPPDNEDLSAAVCPVVYQLDDSPGTRGYHYIFYGNAFFINREGYLLTAAHVLSEFHNGGQPSILVRLAFAPPRLLKTEVIATDLEHDVAILRVTPNPFSGPHSQYTVAALSLGAEKPAIGDSVEAAALRPERQRDPHTFELPIAESYPATVLDYRSLALNPNPQPSIPLVATPSTDSRAQASSSPRQPNVDEPASQKPLVSRSVGDPQVRTDLFLFSHEVQRGQSGAPVASLATHAVVGIIEGRWLHPAAGKSPASAKNSAPHNSSSRALSNSPPPPPALTQGAAIPIPYAIALLQKSNVRWSTSSTSLMQPASSARPDRR
jgi:hypothetical protein